MKLTMFSWRALGAATCCAIVFAPAALAQRAPETAGFIVMIGKDTLAAESYTRTPTVLKGSSMVRSPQTVVRDYTLTLDDKGNLTKYELNVHAASASASAQPLLHATFTPKGETTQVDLREDSARTLMVAGTPALLPIMNLGYGLWETAVMRARRSGKDSVVVPMVFVGNAKPEAIIFKRLGADSMIMESLFGVARMKVDGAGHILGSTSPGSTQQVNVNRVATVDVPALAATYANKSLGQLSPRDTVRASIGGAAVTVDYSRPVKRGRTIFGNVVPWNEVWRTGANAATTLVTDKEIVVGGTPVPPGTYTLFSIPSRNGWTLIVSKRTKEWGTDYDPSADLARIAMQSSHVAAPVEQFTIAIDSQPSGGVMRFAWDDTEARVPVQPSR